MGTTVSGWETNRIVRGLQYRTHALLFNGRNFPQIWDGVTFRYASIKDGGGSPSAAAGSAGLLDGTYTYLLVPVNSKHRNVEGRVMRGRPIQLAQVTVALKQVVISSIPASHADTQVDKWFLYRNRAGYEDTGREATDQPEAYLKVTEITVGTTSYTDNTSDDDLVGNEQITFRTAPIPAFRWGCMYGERAWGTRFIEINTGTATVNVTPNLIDFAGVTIPDGAVGCYFQKVGESRFYEIQSVVSGIQIKLEENFSGTLSGGAFRIYRNPWEIYFSEWGDITAWGYWGEAWRNRFDLPGHEDGMGCTGLFPFKGRLLAFSLQNCFQIGGQGKEIDAYRLDTTPLFDGIGLGCVGGMAICSCDDVLFWMSMRGPVAWTGQGSPQVIPGLGSRLLDLFSAEQLEACCVGAAPDGTIRFAVPESTADVKLGVPAAPAENTIVYRYDPRSQGWFPERFCHPYLYANMRNSAGKPALFYGQGRFIVEVDQGTKDIVESGTEEGTVTSSTTTSATDSHASFADVEEAYIHFFDADTKEHLGSRRIVSNTATRVTWAATGVGGGNLTLAVGDTYKIGRVWWWWKTKDFEAPARSLRSAELHIGVDKDPNDATAQIQKTEYVDGTELDLKEITAKALSDKFPLWRGAKTQALKIECRDGAQVAIRHMTLSLKETEADKPHG